MAGDSSKINYANKLRIRENIAVKNTDRLFIHLYYKGVRTCFLARNLRLQF
jgi:hypothetical protein